MRARARVASIDQDRDEVGGRGITATGNRRIFLAESEATRGWQSGRLRHVGLPIPLPPFDRCENQCRATRRIDEAPTAIVYGDCCSLAGELLEKETLNARNIRKARKTQSRETYRRIARL